MSTTQHTDRPDVEQILLPGQAAAPRGPVDVRMMYVMHHAFRRDLTMFAAAATATPADDRGTWAALAERWRIFAEVLHHHHSGEDAGLWPVLMERATAEEQGTLEAMEAEHAVIDPLLRACAEGFARLAATTDPQAAGDLAERLEATRSSLAHHLAHEETEAMALVQKYFTGEDWDRMEKEHFAKGQSLRQMRELVPWALDRLPEQALAPLLQEAGLPMRLLWKVSRPRFERLDTRARRHLGA
jgi:hemerythrin-like domain-containing protein